MQNRYSMEQLLRRMPGAVLAINRDGELVGDNGAPHPLLRQSAKAFSTPVSRLFQGEAVAAQVHTQLHRIFSEGSCNGFLQGHDEAIREREWAFTGYLLDDDIAVFSIQTVESGRRHPADSSDSLEKRNRLLLALNQVTVQMMDHRPLNALMQDMAALTLELTSAGSSFCHIVRGGGTSARLELVAIAGKEVARPGQRLEKGQGLAGKAWMSGRAEYVEDYQSLPQRLQAIAGITQACALPMISRGSVAGIIGIMYDDFRESIVDQLDLLQQFARLASIAIENSVLMERTRNELVRNRIMNELGSAAFETDDFDELLEITTRAMLNIIQSGSVDVWRMDERGGLSAVGGWQIVSGKIGSRDHAEIEPHRSELMQWLKSGTSVADTADADIVTTLPQLISDPLHNGDSHTIACRAERGIWAMMQVHLRQDSIFSDNIKNVLASVTRQFSIAAQRQRLQRKVRYQAYHDGLTALPNRIQFDLSLQAAVDQGADSGGRFAVIFIDLDGFKLVNDTLGHDIGDRLLIEVARRMRQVLAPRSAPARIGGDEFAAIIWLQSEETEITALADRMLASLRQRYRFDLHSPEISASIGAAIYPQHGTEPSVLLRHADMAMYHAKRDGKNRCCQFNTPSTLAAADSSKAA